MESKKENVESYSKLNCKTDNIIMFRKCPLHAEES